MIQEWFTFFLVWLIPSCSVLWCILPSSSSPCSWICILKRNFSPHIFLSIFVLFYFPQNSFFAPLDFLSEHLLYLTIQVGRKKITLKLELLLYLQQNWPQKTILSQMLQDNEGNILRIVIISFGNGKNAICLPKPMVEWLQGEEWLF